MKLKENQEKMQHRIQTHLSNQNNKNSVCLERNSSTPIPLGHSAVDVRSQKCYNLYSTSGPDKLVASKQRREIL